MTTSPFTLNPNRGLSNSGNAGVSGGVQNVAPFTPGRQRSGQTEANREPKPQSQIWLNVVLCTLDPEAEEGFVRTPLPYGLPIDTMNELSPARSTPEYVMNVVHPRNQALTKLVAFGFSLEPGETRLITPVIFDETAPNKAVVALEIRRTKQAEERPVQQSDLAELIAKAELAF
jgi:hypothetical protein